MITKCHECEISIISSRNYNPSYGISILKREKNKLLISNQHHMVCSREYEQIVHGIKTLDEIENYEKSHPTNKHHPTLFVVTDETNKVLEKKGIYVSLVAPEVSRLVHTKDGRAKFERYNLPEYGFISPGLAESALPNCFRDLTSFLKARRPNKWINLEELKNA